MREVEVAGSADHLLRSTCRIDRIYTGLAWIFLLIALLRGALLIGSDPLLALANNYDMIRVQACIDSYPARDASIPPAAGSHEAPLARYHFVHDVGAACFVTSQAIFAWMAWPGMWIEQALRADSTFSIRWIGSVQWACWMLLAFFCTRRLLSMQRADLALGYAAIQAIVLADPGNTLYLNTFYTEASAIFFLQALLAGIFVALASRKQMSMFLTLAIAASTSLLVLAKIQHLLLPLVIFGALLILRLVQGVVPARLLATLGVGLVVGAGAQFVHMNASHTDAIRSANVVDTLFMSMLPHANPPGALLVRLGLPETCVAQAGQNWYTPGMAERQLCPEVERVSHAALLSELIADPLLALRGLRFGTQHMRPWIPDHLGVVESVRLAKLPTYVPTLSRLLDRLPLSVFEFLLFALPVIGVVFVSLRRSAKYAATNAGILALCGIPLFVMATAVFGDGYVELPKHGQLAFPAMFAAVLTLACVAINALVRRIFDRLTQPQ